MPLVVHIFIIVFEHAREVLHLDYLWWRFGRGSFDGSSSHKPPNLLALLTAGDPMAAAPVGDDSTAGRAATCLRRLLLLPGRRGAALPNQDCDLLISTATSPVARKGGLGTAAALFRGLGCASADAALAYAPPPPSSAAAAIVRDAAVWQARQSKGQRRSGKGSRRKDRDRHQHYAAPPPAPRPLPSRRNVSAADIWCATGISFAAAGDDSIDCVVPRRQRRCSLVEDRGAGRISDGERVQREPSCVERREGGHHLEQLPSSLLDFLSHSAIEVPPVESDLIPFGHRSHLRRLHPAVPEDFEESLQLSRRRYFQLVLYPFWTLRGSCLLKGQRSLLVLLLEIQDDTMKSPTPLLIEMQPHLHNDTN